MIGHFVHCLVLTYFKICKISQRIRDECSALVDLENITFPLVCVTLMHSPGLVQVGTHEALKI